MSGKSRRELKFSPDLSLKRLFVNMDTKRLIDILNTILEKDFERKSKIIFESNEQYDVTGSKKEKVVADLVIRIEEKETKEESIVMVEFQSTTDANMGDRLFIYLLNKSSIKKGVRVLRKWNGNIYGTRKANVWRRNIKSCFSEF